MRIALDVMGTDNHPEIDIRGGILASKEDDMHVIMVGDRAQIEKELEKQNASSSHIEVVHAEQKIGMTDTPSQVVKGKPQSSMHVGLELVKNEQADAFVSAGNTGAALAIATFEKLHRIRGIKRPALAAVYPFNGRPVVILDIGANSECKPPWLAQFAMMGSIYSHSILGINKPRVALISASESNQIVRETDKLLSQQNDIEYVGSMMPNQIMNDKADVIISDGFTGNILLKSFESTMTFISNMLRNEIKSDLISSMGGLLLRSRFRDLRNQLNPSELGGANLLGVNGVVIIGHGGSDPVAIKNIILTAKTAVEKKVVNSIRSALE